MSFLECILLRCAVFFLSVHDFSTRNPPPIFKCSTFAQSNLDLLDFAKVIFRILVLVFSIIGEKKNG